MSQENIGLVVTLSTILLATGGVIWYLNKQNAPFRTNVLQFLVFIWLLPLVCFLAFQKIIDQNVLSALVGVVVGYVFSKASLKEEWGGKD